MEFLFILFSICNLVMILLIYFEIEKVLDNTFEIGNFLSRQEKREIRFAKNLEKYYTKIRSKK